MNRHWLYDAFVTGLLRRRTTLLEWYVAWQTTALGIWVCFLIVLALRFRTRLALQLPFLVLGLCFAALGLLSLYTLGAVRSGRPRSCANLTLCRRNMFLSTLSWAALSVLAGITRPLGLYWPMIAGIGTASLWCYMRLAVRFKED